MNDFYADKTILITGGTGFLGSRLVKKLLFRENPKKVISFSRRWDDGERLLRETSDSRLRVINGDICDLGAISTAMKGVDLVIHTAAYKNVPMGEYNAFECTRVNVFGSMNVASAAIENGVEKVLGISSDKATDPCNTYGATKRLMEGLLISANNKGSTRFSVARYGNVSMSTGAVIPYYHSLMRAGADSLPVTVPRMTRFWIKHSEATDYVLDWLEHMMGGETYVPRLKSSTIEDLVTAFGLLYGKPVEMKIIGSRPGEKRHEGMISETEVERTVAYHWTYMIYPQQHDWDKDYQLKDGFQWVDDTFTCNSDTVERFTMAELYDLIEDES